MHSSHNEAARVDETVTVPAGVASLSFDIATSTVNASQTVTLTATYAGVSQRATLTVTPPPLVASFTVTSPRDGADACVIIEAGTALDCRLNASASTGFVNRYLWTYTMGTDTLTHATPDPISSFDITGGCDYFDTASQSRDSSGNRYLEMNLSLQLQDASGARGDATRRVIRVYPDARCGYDF
jgi:hypothetical protein